ncbi:MAG TPA: hypothetical protein VFU21_17210, partial [Kofleriaceae bacterium]|nr:hypothetical protein [Kofleriaceae bacterium]
APNTLSLPAATFDGTNYIVVWRRAGDIWGSRVTTAGAVLDSTEGVGGVAIAATPNVQADPAITCSASQCLLAWADARDLTDPDNPALDVVAQRLAFDLSPVGGEITVNSFLRNQDEPSLTTVGTGAFLAVWTDARSGVRNVFATRVSGIGAVLDPNGELVNTSSRNAQNRPAYAIGATTQLATWADSRNFGDDIMARRSDAAGNMLGDGAVVVSDAEWDQTGSAVAFDGTRYVVVWRDTRNVDADIFAARMAEDGTLEDPAGIAVTTAAGGQIAPDVASGGGVSLVAWQDRRDPASGYDLMGAILAADGSVAVADIPICQAPDEQVNASVAWDPNSSLFIVAWSDRRTEGSADIYAARVEPDGDVLDPCGVPISQGLNWQTNPDVAVSGSQILIVWADFRDDFFGDVFGGRITADATGIARLDGEGAPIATGASWQTTPVAVGVGLGRWGIAWTDTINDATAGSDILGQTMLADGTLEPAATVLSGGIYFETAPAFPSGSGGSSVTYLLYEYNRPSVGNLRVRRRQLTY